MARAALDWSTQDLAREAEIGANTVNRFEAGQDARVSSVDKMRRAFERSGVIFVEENGEGPGVRLKKQASHADLTKHIDAIKEHLKDAPHDEPPSPASGMRLLERGHKTEVLKKLKGRRAKLEKPR